MAMSHRSAARTLALLAVALALGGCKKPVGATPKAHTPPPPPGGVKSSVSGRVTYHGVGLSSGVVQFFPETGKPAVGMVQMGGTYTVWDPPPGKIKVTVSTTPPSYVSSAPPAPAAGNKLPGRYADPDTSGLTLTVSGGDQRFDINLTD
jgi:hypothetical protein